MIGVFGTAGSTWLDGLPALIDTMAARWSLEQIEPVPAPSYSWVAHARSGDRRVTLKLAVSNPELDDEIASLPVIRLLQSGRIVHSPT